MPPGWSDAAAVLIQWHRTTFPENVGMLCVGLKTCHSYIAQGRLCLIDSDFDIITFGAWCFFHKPQCSPEFPTCFDMGKSFTFDLWLSKCQVKMLFVAFPSWQQLCLCDQLDVEWFSWKLIVTGGGKLPVGSALWAGYCVDIWIVGKQNKEGLWLADSGVILATSWS